MRGAPDSFAAFHLAATSRTPVQILAHIGDLLDWALSLARGAAGLARSPPLPWPDEVSRFFDGARPPRRAARRGGARSASAWSSCFQGPIADALTHVGQLTLLRRLAGAPVRGENYLKADIVAGRVGPEQAPPRREFE